MPKFTERFDSYACDGDSISCSVDGFDVVAQIVRDDVSDAPWDREDGHGPVSDWTRRTKEPGERTLCEDGGSRRYYDVQEATRIAKRDGWDLPPFGKGTTGDRAARAVVADYNALRLWCADEWWYVGVDVCVSRDGVELGGASLWGIDCNHPNGDSNSYLSEVADELLTEAVEEARENIQEEEEEEAANDRKKFLLRMATCYLLANCDDAIEAFGEDGNDGGVSVDGIADLAPTEGELHSLLEGLTPPVNYNCCGCRRFEGRKALASFSIWQNSLDNRAECGIVE